MSIDDKSGGRLIWDLACEELGLSANNASLDELRRSFDAAAADAADKRAQEKADKKITLSRLWALVARDFSKDKSFKIVRDHTGAFNGISIFLVNGVDKITVVDNNDGTFSIGDSKKTS